MNSNMQERIIEDRKQIHYKQLDGLRFIAVFAVMICHWVAYKWVVLIPFGSMGVNLFFVLSGFLITRILLIDSDNKNESIYQKLKRFYIRRSLRIFPIYYLVIIIFSIVNLQPVRDNLFVLFSYLFNLKLSLPGQWEGGKLASIAHLWSLSVEEQFYLFFPFLIFYFNHANKLRLIIVMIAIGLLSRMVLAYFNAPINSLYMFTTACFDSFGIGALLAYSILFKLDLLKKILNNNFLFITSIVLFVGVTAYGRNFISNYGECRTVFERFFFSIACFWIIGKAVVFEYKGWLKIFLEQKIIVYLGKISYGLYLFHPFVEKIINTMSNRFKPFNQFFSTITGEHMIFRAGFYGIASIVVAAISWKVIEKPINELKNKF
jgi:peptidoglycan/LPS O-acetylase OafA/YrhL